MSYPIPWSMSRAEQATLIQLLQTIKPKTAIEIGTYNGGSLQVISEFSDKVYAVDLTPSYRDKRCDNLTNVEYLIGDSKTVVPKLVDVINKNDEIVEFVLIDGDHSSKGVLEDITNVLKLIPKQLITIILHDSFNPACREGISLYNYNSNPFVHYVELDFVTGAFNHDGLYREMWGGFACIEMQTKERETSVTISSYQEKLFKVTYYKSIHFYRKFFWFLKPIYRIFKK
ncbi:class I SAM-dependent methyltransferase [Winogradskyella sp. PG-2]|uniref:class I SAM-dependent methyltransferase n=1 Tax=Winogradskyella sp. PG-2 TaxID=754409 RepID=UPI000458939F|nr:class I SAM-dependent methyltransferase [Winogradskyella sp. PG-2]BAO74370.1 glycosyl transferase group 1 [Winogradskyella sp. PG-2]